MLRLGCFALLVGVVLGLELNLDLKDEWEKFKTVHGKKYSGPEEESKREENFKKNVETIVHHNLKHDMGVSSFRQGISEFSDMSHEEFVKNMNGVKLPRTHKKNKKAVGQRSKRATLPDYLDWRDQYVVSPVKNQGSTCGDCWAFSATGAIESAWAIATGNLVVLSDQQLTDCVNSSIYDCDGCNGGWPDQAMAYVVANNGQDKESCYPDLFTQNSKCMYQPSCNAVSISDYGDIMENTEEALKEYVVQQPISVCMDASQPDFQNYQTGIYSNPNCSRTITDHAILLVGYGTENGQDYWLLKNSWGTSWGQLGYFQLARNDNDMCAIATQASYPVV